MKAIDPLAEMQELLKYRMFIQANGLSQQFNEFDPSHTTSSSAMEITTAPDRSRSNSDGNASIASTAVGDVTIGYEAFLDFSLKKDDQNKVSVRISDERFKTWLGEKQGDHVVTYELFLRFCAAKIDGQSIRDIPHILKIAVESIMPEISAQPGFPSTPEILLQEKMTYGFQGFSKEQVDTYNIGKRYEQTEAVKDYVLDLVKHYSKMKEVTRAKTGNKKGNEGSETHAALTSLKAINELLKLNEMNLSVDEHAEEKRKFTRRCLEPGGDLVNGMRKIFFPPPNDIKRNTNGAPVLDEKGNSLKNGIAEVRELFVINGGVEGFHQQFSTKINNALIGQLAEVYFDFPHMQHPLEHSGKLLSGNASEKTVLEPQGLPKLILAASECLAFTFAAFEKIGKVINIKDSVSSFIGQVKQNQGWSEMLNPSNREMVEAKIENSIKLKKADEDANIANYHLRKRAEKRDKVVVRAITIAKKQSFIRK
jgi:hypothetical protein